MTDFKHILQVHVNRLEIVTAAHAVGCGSDDEEELISALLASCLANAICTFRC